MKALVYAALACLLAGPLAAQTGKCRAEWARLNDFLMDVGALESALPGIPRQTATGGCRIDGVTFEVDDFISIVTDQVEWSGTDMARFVEDGMPPRAINLRVGGISFAPDFGNKPMNYLNRLQNQGRGIDLLLVASWNEETRGLSLDNLTTTFPGDDYIHAVAEFDNVDLSTANTLQMSAGSMSLTRMVTEVRSIRLFQDYLLQPLGAALLFDSDDPEASVNELKKQGSDLIAEVPDTLLSPVSKRALITLIDDMPTPAGTLRVETVAEPGIGAARFLPMARRGVSIPGDLWPVLDGVRIDITYRPE